MGEPILVNSDSFENLEAILNQLHENKIENSKRLVFPWCWWATVLFQEMFVKKNHVSMTEFH